MSPEERHLRNVGFVIAGVMLTFAILLFLVG